jgi:hypothetical protein
VSVGLPHLRTHAAYRQASQCAARCEQCYVCCTNTSQGQEGASRATGAAPYLCLAVFVLNLPSVPGRYQSTIEQTGRMIELDYQKATRFQCIVSCPEAVSGVSVGVHVREGPVQATDEIHLFISLRNQQPDLR